MSTARVVTGMLFLSVMGAACGQDYPTKPIRIVTTAAGGGGDFTTRQIAQGISGPLGQPVVVDNRANGFLAAEIVYKAPADGYTLTVQGSTFWILPLLRKLPYDVMADFAPISLIEQSVNIVAVNPSVPAKSVKELIDLAKAKPGALNYGASSVGSTSHLAGELFKSLAGVNITMVPYKGAAPALAALISGELQLFISDVGLLMPHAKSGKLRALAITSAEPSMLAPGLPTVAASGVPGYEALLVTGIYAPAKTPAAVINRLHQEIVRVLNRPDVKERFLNAGVETVGTSPQQFAAIIKSDSARMGKVITNAGIKLE